jgi:hypothetical protein
MRLLRVTALAFTVLVGVAIGFNDRGSLRTDMSAAETISSTPFPSICQQGVPVRVPDTASSQPGAWPQQGTKRTVDITDLRNRATELATLSKAVPLQMDQIGNGKYPKDLIDNLKKIEKLSKHIRNQIE